MSWVGVCDAVGVMDAVGVCEAVGVIDAVGVCEAVGVIDAVGVMLTVGVGVGVGSIPARDTTPYMYLTFFASTDVLQYKNLQF